MWLCSREVRLALSSLLLLHLFRDAVGSVEDCALEIQVKRNTLWKVFTEQPLRLNCSIKTCGWTVNMSWCKLADSNFCENIEETDRIKITKNRAEESTSVWLSYLHFQHTILNDSGSYRCAVSERVTTVSHSINVIVTVSLNNESVTSGVNVTDAPAEIDNVEFSHLYVFISSGVLIFIVLILGFTFCISQQCQGPKHSEQVMKSHYQCEASVGLNYAVHGPVPPVRTRSVRVHPTSPSARPGEAQGTQERRTSRKRSTKASVRTPPTRTCATNEEPLAISSSTIYDNDSCIQGEEQSCIVYAALNHQPTQPNPGSTRTSIIVEEFSEYAAIRVS